MTTEGQFKRLTELIKRTIVAAVSNYTEECPLDPSLPPVGLAFKGQEYDDSSGGSFNTYLSACSSVFSNQNDDFSYPPDNSSPAIQAWGPTPPKIPREFQTELDTQVESGLSSEGYARVDHEKEKMAKEIRDLKAQVKSLLQISQQPQVPPPQPNFDMQAIIEATTRAVMQSIHQQEQHQQQHQGNAPSSLLEELSCNSDANAGSEDRQNMSFESGFGK